jgi:aminoglycoside 3-N-acetyltransferase
MSDTKLFKAKDGTWITNGSILNALEQTGASDAGILYIHSGLTLGIPNPEISRANLLECIFESITRLGVPIICVPTFTFSFCNGHDYNVQSSCSKMGALNEYIRKLPTAHRSVDPLMSTAMVGEGLDLVQGLGKASIGERSTFDKLHQRGREVKFLFIGTSVRECFTYTHYVEERLSVPYRYNREFTGTVTDGDHSWRDSYTLFVRYRGVVPASDGLLENYLYESGALRKRNCGDSSISCLDEPIGYEVIVNQLQENIDCYIVRDPHDRSMEFFARNMVAL